MPLDNGCDLFRSLGHLRFDVGYKTASHSKATDWYSVFITKVHGVECLFGQCSAYNQLIEYRGIEAPLVKVYNE